MAQVRYVRTRCLAHTFDGIALSLYLSISLYLRVRIGRYCLGHSISRRAASATDSTTAPASSAATLSNTHVMSFTASYPGRERIVHLCKKDYRWRLFYTIDIASTVYTHNHGSGICRIPERPSDLDGVADGFRPVCRHERDCALGHIGLYDRRTTHRQCEGHAADQSDHRSVQTCASTCTISTPTSLAYGSSKTTMEPCRIVHFSHSRSTRERL